MCSSCLQVLKTCAAKSQLLTSRCNLYLTMKRPRMSKEDKTVNAVAIHAYAGLNDAEIANKLGMPATEFEAYKANNPLVGSIMATSRILGRRHLAATDRPSLEALDVLLSSVDYDGIKLAATYGVGKWMVAIWKRKYPVLAGKLSKIVY